MTEEYKRQTPDIEEAPPFFKQWKGWYAVVLINLLALIALFYVFTKIFE